MAGDTFQRFGRWRRGKGFLEFFVAELEMVPTLRTYQVSGFCRWNEGSSILAATQEGEYNRDTKAHDNE